MRLRSNNDFSLTLFDKENFILTFEQFRYWTIKTYYVVYVWYAKQMTYLTKYFPFSLIGQDKTFHYENRDIRTLMQLVVSVAKTCGPEFMVEASLKDEHFYYVSGYYVKGRKRINNRAMLKELQKRLKLAQGGLYIRKLSNDRVRFLIPRETANIAI